MAIAKLMNQIKDWDKSNKSRHQSTRAAEILFDVICTYKPTFYDAFGYDFSGRRKRLIETFIDDPHDKKVDKYYGDELLAMKIARKKGRILQELKFGLLVNKILDDLRLDLNSKAISENMHWSVCKIAKASHNEYKEYKKTHPLHKPSKCFKKEDEMQLA